MMRILLFSIVAFSMIGLIFPSGIAEIFIDESDYPFSIQYPPDWNHIVEDEFGGVWISKGDGREEIACSSEKTRVDPEKKNRKANILSVQGKVCLQRKKVCSFRLEAVSNMISNEISVQQD